MANQKKLVREAPVDLGDSRQVRLGDRDFTVVPQRIGYLRQQMGIVLGGIADLDLNAGNILEVLGDRAYGLLNIFIDDFMEPWEFVGYPTKEALEAGDYKEEYDHSPSPPQIRKALTAVAEINEVDLLKHLGKVIPLPMVKAYIAGVMADSMTENSSKSLLTNGDTDSMTSTAPSETSA